MSQKGMHSKQHAHVHRSHHDAFGNPRLLPDGAPFPDFYGTRIFVQIEIDGDKTVALESLGDILEGVIEREDVISCSGEVGPEGIIEQAATNDGEDANPTGERGTSDSP